MFQTIRHAARHVTEIVLLLLENMTDSMVKAIGEMEPRRSIRKAYKGKYVVTPQSAHKKSIHSQISAFFKLSKNYNEEHLDEALVEPKQDAVPLKNRSNLIQQFENDFRRRMPDELDFQKAANLRCQIQQLRQQLVGAT